jgi:aminopeptidase N
MTKRTRRLLGLTWLPVAAATLASTALASAALAAGATAAGDPTAPLGAVTRQQGGVLPAEEMALSFEHLDLTLKIDPAIRSIAGDATLTLKASTPIGAVILDLYPLYSIEAVYLNKVRLTATAYRNWGGKLKITPHSRIAAGRTLSVRIVYAGIPHVAQRPPWDGGVVWSTTADGQPWVGSSLWGGGCDMLWPCIDHPRRRPALADLHYIVPAPLVAPANGVFMGMTERDGWRTWNWRARSPHTYGVVINVGPFKLLEADYHSRFGNQIPLKFWYLPGEEEKAAALFKEFPLILDFFESQIGPYPWWDQKMGVVETSFSGMEHQTINGYGSHYAKTIFGYDDLLEHEFAHEYFANPFLGNYDDLWLHEGFASYMQPLFGKYLDGDMDYYSMLMSQRASILNEQPLVTGRERSEQEVYDDHATGPTGDVYGKASLILHSLRELIGDAAFYESLRWLLYGRPDPKPGNFSSHFATTHEFIEIVNRVTGRDYSWFFQVYLYRAALPQLIAERDGNLLKLLWRTPDDLPFPLPVEVRLADRIVTVPMESGRGEIELEPNADWTLDPHTKLLRQSAAIDRFRAWKAAQPK